MAHTINLETNEFTALLKSIELDKKSIMKALLLDKLIPSMVPEANDFIDMYTKVAIVAIDSGEYSNCVVGTVQELQDDCALIKAHINKAFNNETII